jgi:subtilisin family serine protease
MRKLLVAAALCTSMSVHAGESQQIATVIKQGGVDLAWARGITGRGVTVAIIDQGFDINHADLRGKILAAKNFTTSTVTWGAHGTAMASIAAGARNGVGTVGVAPDARLLLAQVGTGGTSTNISESSVYSALRWVSASGAHVANLSFSAEYAASFNRAVAYNYNQKVYLAPVGMTVNYGADSAVISNYAAATSRGTILVTSAGNQGLGYASFPGQLASRIDSTGQLALGGRMIVVGAVDGSNRILDYSNRAGHICQISRGTTCADPYRTTDFYVVAPGNLVYAAVPNALGRGINTDAAQSGTSSAAAYVTGGMALIKQAWPSLRPEQLVNLVLMTARDLGTPGTDNVYGRGLVDFDQASRPQGQLRMASAQKTLGTATSQGQLLSITGASIQPGLAAQLKTSSVLQQTQVLDSLDRNYTADLTRAIGITRSTNMVTVPWLTWTGHAEQRFHWDNDTELKIWPAQSGMAMELIKYQNAHRYSVQLGTIEESQGFLGNYGRGSMNMGSSQTTWVQLATGYNFLVNHGGFAQYGLALTRITNDPTSVFTFDPMVMSRSWRFGYQGSGLLHNGDQLQISLGTPVTVKSGTVTVGSVTDYKYEYNQDESVTGVPVYSRQRFNLAYSDQVNFAVNYAVPVTKNTGIQSQLLWQNQSLSFMLNFAGRL